MSWCLLCYDEHEGDCPQLAKRKTARERAEAVRARKQETPA